MGQTLNARNESVKLQAFGLTVAAISCASLTGRGDFLFLPSEPKGLPFSSLSSIWLWCILSFVFVLIPFLYFLFHVIFFHSVRNRLVFPFQLLSLLWETLHKRDMDFLAPESSASMKMTKICIFKIIQKINVCNSLALCCGYREK